MHDDATYLVLLLFHRVAENLLAFRISLVLMVQLVAGQCRYFS